jgi:hypothetical protein
MFEIAADTKKVWDRSGDRSERTVYQVAMIGLQGVWLHVHEFVEDLEGAERLLARVRAAKGQINKSLWHKSNRPKELRWPYADPNEFREVFDGEPNWLENTEEELNAYYSF